MGVLDLSVVGPPTSKCPIPAGLCSFQQLAGLTCATFCFHALLVLPSKAPVSENPVAAALVTTVNSSGV